MSLKVEIMGPSFFDVQKDYSTLSELTLSVVTTEPSIFQQFLVPSKTNGGIIQMH